MARADRRRRRPGRHRRYRPPGRARGRAGPAPPRDHRHRGRRRARQQQAGRHRLRRRDPRRQARGHRGPGPGNQRIPFTRTRSSSALRPPCPWSSWRRRCRPASPSSAPCRTRRRSWAAASSPSRPGPTAPPEQLQRAKDILAAAGTVVEIPEEQVDALSAISGSGPAYAFYLAEAMAEAGARTGPGPGAVAVAGPRDRRRGGLHAGRARRGSCRTAQGGHEPERHHGTGHRHLRRARTCRPSSPTAPARPLRAPQKSPGSSPEPARAEHRSPAAAPGVRRLRLWPRGGRRTVRAGPRGPKR